MEGILSAIMFSAQLPQLPRPGLQLLVHGGMQKGELRPSGDGEAAVDLSSKRGVGGHGDPWQALGLVTLESLLLQLCLSNKLSIFMCLHSLIEQCAVCWARLRSVRFGRRTNQS